MTMLGRIAVFGISGGSDTGKTERICRTVEALSEKGYKVATIKHTREDFTLDEEGKDTWKHSGAGADLVVFSTPIETDFLLQRPLALENLLEKICALGKYDVVLIEGMKDEDIPTLGSEEDTVESIEEEIEKKKILGELPGLDCQKCGLETCQEMALEIYLDNKIVNDCKVLDMKKERVQMLVNDEPVPLGEFPSKMVERTVKGMVSSLKGVNKTDKIEIKISED